MGKADHPVPGALLAALLLLVSAAEAQADGCFVWKAGADLREPSQKAIIHFASGSETLILQVKYEGPAKDFAWIVPLPAQPKVEAIQAKDSPFAEISQFTQRRQRYEIDGLRGGPDAGVTVLQRKVVGVYDIAVLAASDAKALSDWLARHGYGLPEQLRSVLGHYVQKRWVYAAMRIDPKALASDEVKKLKTGELQPIRFTFASKQMVYPLRISSVNAGETEVLLYLLADAPLVLASGPARPGLSPDVIVPRYYQGPSRCDPKYTTPPPVTGQALSLTWKALRLSRSQKRHLVKYRAIYTGRQMTDDLAFKPFEPLPYWKARLAKAGSDPWQRKRILEFLAVLDPAYKKELQAAERAIREQTRRQEAQRLAERQEKIRRKAGDADPAVRQAALDSPEAPRDVLLLLAADPVKRIRKLVAGRPGTGPEVLAKLAADADPEVRLAAAQHQHTPADVLRKLTQDENPGIARRAEEALGRRARRPQASLSPSSPDR